MTGRPGAGGRTGIPAAVERVVAAWALAGGMALLAIVAVNVLEVASSLTAGWTGHFAGAVELTAMLAAVAGFCFLPHAQLAGANVSADIFTARLPPRGVAALRAIGCLVAAAFGLLLAWRMGEGLADQRARGLASAILAVPIWPAYAVAVVSLVLTAAAGAVGMWEAGRTAAGGGEG